MPVTRHSIVLNITGNAKRAIDDIARKMKAAGGAIVGAFRGADVPDIRGTGAARPDAGKSASTRGTAARPRAAAAGVGAAGLQTGMAMGTQIAAGGTFAGAAGAGLGGAGGIMRGMGGKIAGVGMGVAAAGMMMSFVGRMSDQFQRTVDQMSQIAGVTGEYNLKNMMKGVREVAIDRAVMPEVVRQITAVVSRETGEQDFAKAADIGELANVVGGASETFAKFSAMQERFSTGRDIRDAVTMGTVKGLKIGHLGEFLEGTMSLQEQLTQAGVMDRGQMEKMLASIGTLHETLRGKYGARVAGGMQAQIQAAGAGGGGLLTTLLYTALGGKGLGYYQIRRRAEMGIGGPEGQPGNLQVIIDLIKEMGGPREYQAEVLSRAFQSVSFTTAERLLGLEEISKEDLDLSKKELKRREELYKGEQAFEYRKVLVTRATMKEDISEATSKIETVLAQQYEELKDATTHTKGIWEFLKAADPLWLFKGKKTTKTTTGDIEKE